jgi:hypothetical protein
MGVAVAGGRPGKLTPEVQKKLVDATRAGCYRRVACGYAGVTLRTVERWTRKGKRARQGPYRDFYESMRKAEADCEVSTVASWMKTMPAHPGEFRHFLSRRFPQRWSEKRRLELLGKRGGPALSRQAVEGMSDAELHRLIDQLLGARPGFAAGRLAGKGPAPFEAPEDGGRPEAVGAPAGPDPAPAADVDDGILVDGEALFGQEG